MLSLFFSSTSVRFLTPESVEISWSIESSPYEPNAIGFQVFKSDVQTEGFTQISPTLTDLLLYRDFYEGDTTSKWRKVYYKVRAFLHENPSSYVEGPVSYVHENPLNDGNSPFADPVVDVVRRNNFALSHPRYRLGKPCVAYQKRVSGRRCKCFDPVTQRVTVSKCDLCMGTGFLHGYHSGIEDVYVHFVSLSKQKMIQAWGDHEPGSSQAWTSNFPILKPEDILVNTLFNEHWLVLRIRTSFHLIVSRQTMVVRKLNYDDVKRRLPFEVKTFRV